MSVNSSSLSADPDRRRHQITWRTAEAQIQAQREIQRRAEEAYREIVRAQVGRFDDVAADLAEHLELAISELKEGRAYRSVAYEVYGWRVETDIDWLGKPDAPWLGLMYKAEYDMGRMVEPPAEDYRKARQMVEATGLLRGAGWMGSGNDESGFCCRLDLELVMAS